MGANAFIAGQGRSGGLLLPAECSKLGQNAFLTPIPSRGTPLLPQWAGEPPLQIVPPDGDLRKGSLAVAVPQELREGLPSGEALPSNKGVHDIEAGGREAALSHSLALVADEVDTEG